MRIIDIPSEKVRQLALGNQRVQAGKANSLIELNCLAPDGGFDWEKSPEGHTFWGHINEGLFEEAQAIIYFDIDGDLVKMDPINPDHYKSYSVECIDMMIQIYGEEIVANYCELNAFKYRMRMGKKDDFQVELQKEKWYLEKAAELRK